MVSIIVPAHNEESVIGELLSALMPICSADGEVIVVCNGCTDDTEGVVRRLFPAVRCLRAPIASKTEALNLGDSSAAFYPRVYLDADVIMDDLSVRRMCKALESGWLAAAPCVEMELAHASRLVRAYYRVWLALPYSRAGMIGAGAYGLSEAGRARFGKFPDIIADDGYVRALFAETERTVVLDASSRVRAPRTLMALIKIKTRSRLGRYELAERYPELMSNETKSYRKALREIIAEPGRWADFMVYLVVNAVTRMRARVQFRRGGWRWERDLTTRC